MRRSIVELERYIEEKAESAIDDKNKDIKNDILKIIEKKKKELSTLKSQLIKLTKQESDDKREFMEFALSFIQDTGRHFLEPTVSKERRLMCKQMLFPAGIFIDEKNKVYTPEISVFKQVIATKKDLPETEKSFMVRVGGL